LVHEACNILVLIIFKVVVCKIFVVIFHLCCYYYFSLKLLFAILVLCFTHNYLFNFFQTKLLTFVIFWFVSLISLKVVATSFEHVCFKPYAIQPHYTCMCKTIYNVHAIVTNVLARGQKWKWRYNRTLRRVGVLEC
jgi:hypothetical protein